MRLKEAILAKGEKAHHFSSTFLGIDFRGRIENYYEAYSLEQLSYLVKHGFLRKYEKSGASWEKDNVEYWEFTEKGKFFRIWFTTSFWDYIRIYVLHLWRFKNVWQRFMIKVFNKHYAWQDYEGVSNLDEI